MVGWLMSQILYREVDCLVVGHWTLDVDVKL